MTRGTSTESKAGPGTSREGDGQPGTGLPDRRLRELEALYSISRAIHGSLDSDQVLHHALQQVLAVFEFPAGVMRLLDARTGELVLTAQAGLSPHLAHQLPRALRIGEGPAGL